MNNIVQVVEVTPTPAGQWITFWHAASSLRVSGEIQTDAFVTAFDRGDVYVCVNLDDENISMVGPLSVDFLKPEEFSALPIAPDQKNYARHTAAARYDLDRTTALLSPVLMPNEFRKAVSGQGSEETIKMLARFH